MNALTRMTRARATGSRSHANYDDERKEVLDPHYVSEIAMLQRSLATDWLTARGIETTRARLAHLIAIAPNFDGRRMVGSGECRCARCVTSREMETAQ